MIARLPNIRIRTWTGVLIAIGIAAALWVVFAPSVLAQERVRGTEIRFNGQHEDFTGAEPPVCDLLGFEGTLKGEMFGDSSKFFAEIQAVIEQTGCRLSGKLQFISPSLAGSGPLHGTIDGNFVRFTVPGETNDVGVDVNFSGLIDGDRVSGQYTVPSTGETGGWILIGEAVNRFRFSDLTEETARFRLAALIREIQATLSALRQERSDLAAELEHQLEIDSADVQHRWELAIKELQAEVELEIELVIRQFELEKRQVSSSPDRNRKLRELNRELEFIIQEMKEQLEEEVAFKERLLSEELNDIEREKTLQLDQASRFIKQVEFELNQKLEQSGVTLEQIRDFTAGETVERTRVAQPVVEPSVVDRSETVARPAQLAETPSGAEHEQERGRGFFFNAESGAIGGLGDALDPATLAVIGILITLAATTVQLVKGN